MRRTTGILGIALVLLLPAGAPGYGASQEQIKSSIDKGLKWLRGQMEENGSWRNYPGITALCLTAYARSPRAYSEEDGPFIRKPVEYLVGLQKDSGGIYDKDLEAYNTAVAIMALYSLRNPEYDTVIRKAQDFLAGIQCDEGEGYAGSDKFYGGIGYGNDERPDLSNLQMCLQALKDSCYDEKAELWGKALQFIERCQNLDSDNPDSASNDGGFVYYPGKSEAGEVQEGTRTVQRSYGSMTYAGVKSYIHAGLEKDDPRVRAAMNWIAGHYSLDENHPIGNQGLFYYYHTFAKTFSVIGEKEFTDAKGVKHHWSDELSDKLLSLQSAEGNWVNSSQRWWEADPVLCTAYAVLALEECYSFADKEPTP